MTNLHFFKRPGRPVYMMIDSNPERPYMTTITAKDGYNSVAHCDDGAHVKRMLQSTTDGRDIEVISFDEYFRIAANVDAVINGNYAIDAGLALEDAVAQEDANSAVIQDEYANVIVTTPELKDDERIVALVAALQTDDFKDYLVETFGDAVQAAF